MFYYCELSVGGPHVLDAHETMEVSHSIDTDRIQAIEI